MLTAAMELGNTHDYGYIWGGEAQILLIKTQGIEERENLAGNFSVSATLSGPLPKISLSPSHLVIRG